MTSLNSLVTLQLTWSFGSTLCKRHLFLNSLLSRSSLGSFWSGAQRTFLWIRENKMTELSQWAWESSPSALNCFFLCVCVCVSISSSHYNAWPTSVLQMSYIYAVNVPALVHTVEQVGISMLPTGDYPCSPFTIWLLEGGGALRVFDSIGVHVQHVCINQDPWEAERWGGGHLKVTWGRGDTPVILWVVMTNMSPVTHLLLITTNLFKSHPVARVCCIWPEYTVQGPPFMSSHVLFFSYSLDFSEQRTADSLTSRKMKQVKQVLN